MINWLGTIRKRGYDNWKSRDRAGKCYLAARYLIILPAVALFFSQHDPSRMIFWAIPSMLLFGIGFVAWAIPNVLARLFSRPWLWLLIGLQAVLFPICVGLARGVVAASLGLPPQSFELTVTLLALLIVPLAWVFLLSLISLLGVSLGAVAWFLGHAVVQGAEFLRGFHRAPSHATSGLKGKLDRTFEHMMGYLVTLSLVLGLFSFYEGELRRPGMVRLAAYALDFNRVSNYPGVQSNRPMRLLDNGKVAYATRDGWEVLIEVDSVRPD